MFSNARKGLYAITSNNDTLVTVEAVLRAGAVLLQYREKQVPDAAHAQALKNLCHRYEVLFIINDDTELVRTVEADGVHLGEEDSCCETARKQLGKDAIIGVSCYDSLDLAIKAQKLGADYVAFGSFFPSKTKHNTRRPGLNLLRQARAQLSIPIVAIGGITPENGRPLVAAGVSYLAVIHGLFGQANPALAAQNYAELFEEKS